MLQLIAMDYKTTYHLLRYHCKQNKILRMVMKRLRLVLSADAFSLLYRIIQPID